MKMHSKTTFRTAAFRETRRRRKRKRTSQAIVERVQQQNQSRFRRWALMSTPPTSCDQPRCFRASLISARTMSWRKSWRASAKVSVLQCGIKCKKPPFLTSCTGKGFDFGAQGPDRVLIAVRALACARAREGGRKGARICGE
eukprot:3092228-Rhodomonas_salina.3